MLLGGGITAPLLAAAKSFATFGSELYDMSARTGMGTNALSELGFAAEQSGASLEDVELSVKRMQKAITAAKDGPLAGLKGMKPEEQFMQIAESIAGIQDPTARAAKAVEIFGRGGTRLIPMLADVKALRAEAVRLGLSMGPEQAAAADALGDAWDKCKATFKSAAIALGSALAPMLTGLAEKMATGIASVRAWVAANKPLIVNLFMAGVATLAFGAAVFALGKVITVFGMVFAAALGTIKFAIASFGLLQAGVLLLANPVVLLGVGIAALGAYFLYTSGAADNAIASMKTGFSSLLSETTETFGVIAESMAAGDLVSAAKVGWAFIQLEWIKGIESIKNSWNNGMSFMSLVFVNVGAEIRQIWTSLLNWMSKTWMEFEASTFTEQTAGLFARLAKVWDQGVFVVPTKEKRAEVIAAGEAAKQDVRDRKAALPKQFAAMDAETAANKARIEKDRIGRENILLKDRDAYTKAAQDKVDAAGAEWNAAKAEAKAKAAAVAKEAAKAPGMPAMDLIDAIASKTRGTFSASELGSMAGGNPILKMVKASLDVKKISEDMLNELKRLTLETVA